MVWDTTANNTGVHEGAAVHFERTIGHAILHIPCRKHMYELHMSHAYEALFGKTKGPDNLLFKSFKEWYITQLSESERNHTIFPDPATYKKWTWPRPTSVKNRKLIAWGNEVLALTTHWLTEGTFPREDYREDVELIHYILGGPAIR